MKFDGISLDAPRANLPPGKFQVDAGGDRIDQGSWKRRRGMRHTDVAKADGAIVSILGFELAGAGYGLVYAEGANAHGEANVAEQ